MILLLYTTPYDTSSSTLGLPPKKSAPQEVRPNMRRSSGRARRDRAGSWLGHAHGAVAEKKDNERQAREPLVSVEKQISIGAASDLEHRELGQLQTKGSYIPGIYGYHIYICMILLFCVLCR